MITMDKAEAERKNKARKAAMTLACIGLVVMTVLIFLVPGVVRTGSMDNGLDGCIKDGDILLMNRMQYSEKHAPEYGDLTIFKEKDPSTGKEVNIPARVIGNDGDVIEIKGNAVYRNGKQLDEDYAIGSTRAGDKTKYTVPKESAFLLGDNREEAVDSRTVGCVSRRDLGGKIVFRILPFGEFGTIK